MNIHNILVSIESLRKEQNDRLDKIESMISDYIAFVGGGGSPHLPLQKNINSQEITPYKKEIIKEWVDYHPGTWVEYKEYEDFAKKVGMKTVMNLVHEFTGEKMKGNEINKYVKEVLS